MLLATKEEIWTQVLEVIRKKISQIAFNNWIAPIHLLPSEDDLFCLEIPNIFVKEYLLSNFREELRSFLPVAVDGETKIHFEVKKPQASRPSQSSESSSQILLEKEEKRERPPYAQIRLNPDYRFDTFIEGPQNQFVKSAAMGVAARPGQSYSPLFIHGGVGLGKTHILHSIGHYICEHHKKLRVQCITTEAFINELVECLKNKSIEKMKRYYRSEVDVLLVDDIQFLQNRLNFEEEITNTFETLLNQHKQIVITSDNPPAKLKLSNRMSARLECGLVAHIGVPDLETRVAILQLKAERRGLHIPSKIAFYIAEHIYHNVRQLEGAINRLSAHARLLNLNITEEFVEATLKEMLRETPKKKVSVEEILRSVSLVYEVNVEEIKGSSRKENVALPRQVAMYLARMYLAKMHLDGSLVGLGESFGKRHSTILHACKAIEKKMATSEHLRKQIAVIRSSIEQAPHGQ